MRSKMTANVIKGVAMDSILTAIMLALLSYKCKNKSLLMIASFGCASSELMYIMIDDVVLYYSILTMIAATLAFNAFQLKSIPAKTYAVLMAINSTLCCLLIFSFTPQFNALIESTIIMYNDHMLMIVSVLAIIGSDNIISRAYYESKAKESK